MSFNEKNCLETSGGGDQRPPQPDFLLPFLVACGVPLNAIQESLPITSNLLPLTGTNTGQFGLLLTVGYIWTEIQKFRGK